MNLPRGCVSSPTMLTRFEKDCCIVGNSYSATADEGTIAARHDNTFKVLVAETTHRDIPSMQEILL